MKIKEKIFIAKNSEETKKLGYDFAKDVKGGDIICLYGDLGSGKTTFVQGLAKGLGIRQRIISPTFIIIRNYRIMNHESPLRPGFEGQARIMNFYHIDLYRLENEKDIENLGIEEIINNKNNIVVVEWAEKLGRFLPEKRIDIKFVYMDKDKRKIITSKIS